MAGNHIYRQLAGRPESVAGLSVRFSLGRYELSGRFGLPLDLFANNPTISVGVGLPL